MIKKADLMSMIVILWQYRKHNEIPFKYYFEDD
jgi:hypothetical protein